MLPGIDLKFVRLKSEERQRHPNNHAQPNPESDKTVGLSQALMTMLPTFSPRN
jgi:hypothetical protein